MKPHQEADRFHALLIAYLQQVQNHYSVDRPAREAIAKLIKQAQSEAARTRSKN